MTIEEGSYLEKVKAQYEDYPYPARDPEEEKGVLYSSRAASLDALNYYCFEGKRDLSKDFRVLIPGGGTGDCTIYLAEQLRNTEAEIVYLDMSEASMALAKERAKVRKLDNITWVHDSILNIPKLDLGKFDFITCTGVLHHLTDPQAGLDALKSVLADDGSIFLMLYGLYGRLGIYQMQDTLKRLNAGVESVEQQVKNARKVIDGLPPSNWLAVNYGSYAQELKTDIGLYDLLLHSQDRAYTVPQLYDYVEASGLTIHKLFNPNNLLGDMLFEPSTFIKDKTMLGVVNTYPFREQAAICEGIFGHITKQNCFISFKEKSVPSVDNLELIPNLSVALSRHEITLKQAFSNKRSVQINESVAIHATANMEALFNAIDGQRSSKEIVELVLKSSTQKKAGFDQILAEYKSMFGALVKVGAIFLREANVPKYKTMPELLERMHEYYDKEECDRILQEHINKGKN